MSMSKANQDRVERGEIPMGVVDVQINFRTSGDHNDLAEWIEEARNGISEDPEVSDLIIRINGVEVV